jgi:PAS domain S-box-containing protein
MSREIARPGGIPKRDRPTRAELETRYELLVEHAPIGMCEVSRNGSVRWVNRALAEMLGYESAHELVDPHIVIKDSPVLIDERVFSQLASRGGVAIVETEWRRKDGGRIAVRLRGCADPRIDAADELPETVAIIAEDISEQRSLEERLRTTHKLEAIGRLAGGIAHDFNNMLTAIHGYSDMLLEQFDEQKPIFGDLQEISKAATRAATLTRQLLAFSRRQVLKLEPLDLNVVVQDVEPMIRRLIGEHITTDTRLVEPPPVITADRSQIDQVLVNLALNARDAMPHGGRVTFETSLATLDDGYASSHDGCASGEYVCLSVADTGVGMTAEVREQIFDPFFTTKRLGHGTGLGLATVYGTVKQLGGYIWVYSEPDHGAIFKLYFPRVDAAVTNQIPRQERHGQPVGAESVLLVEDEATVRTFCKTVLRRHGYQVVEAANPSEAFAVLQTAAKAIDLVVTDVAMPGMNGDEMVRRLRGTIPPFKTLFMSGYADQLSQQGIDDSTDLLEKPFTASQLLHRVREALDRAT